MQDDSPQLPKPVYVLSDSTGETAEKMVRAALRQFRGHLVHVRRFPEVDNTDDLRGLMRKAAAARALVITTLVSHEMRELAARLASDLELKQIDLLHPLLGAFESYLEQAPEEVPGLLHEVNERYFRRIEAVEFTVKADDGKEPRMLVEADIVLVGVSRTSKTPLSTFLAHKGFKVGNVPLVLDRPPPPQLFNLDERRIFGLTIDPEKLRSIRRNRLRAMGMHTSTNYGDLDYILAELEYANDLFRSNLGWPVLDVTFKAIEETAANILRIYQDRGFDSPLGDISSLQR